MIQKLIQPLGTYAFQTQPVQVNLVPGTNVHELLLHVQATVTIVDPGGGAAGTVQTENIARLLRSIRLRHDGIDRMILNGRWSYRLYRACGLDYIPMTDLAGAGAQVGTVIDGWLSIPFERPWNSRPSDTVWSGQTPVAQELALFLEWEQGACNAIAGTDPGSIALAQTDNTMSVTFATGPSVEVFQVYSTNAFKPAFVPHYTMRATDPFAAANAQLEYSLLGHPKFDYVFARDLYGAFDLAQAGINFFTLQVAGGATRYYNRIDAVLLQLLERRGFPGVTINADSRVGDYTFAFPEKGKLSTIVVPSALNDPRFVFDVDAPTAGTGRIHMLFCELHKIPGVTRDDL